MILDNIKAGVCFANDRLHKEQLLKPRVPATVYFVQWTHIKDPALSFL